MTSEGLQQVDLANPSHYTQPTPTWLTLCNCDLNAVEEISSEGFINIAFFLPLGCT